MKQGKILLVSLGPGAAEHMSQRAREAIGEAEVVIGYSTYIKLLQGQGLLEGKDAIRSPMTEEIGRCQQAVDLARSGKIVALVSSGDIGIYGMAGPTYEVLLQSGWTPATGFAVEVIPGASALSTCASLVGAPLTHDFCTISLSDLLTPWPVIARRIEAAARADFVIAFYNPKSGRRTGQIAEAQRILLSHRRPDTAVAIVKSAYRETQQIRHLRLDELLDAEIGMLSTVLVGNSMSYQQAGLMITPRGYANKYEDLTGDTKAGEKAGRSLSLGLEGWKASVRRYLCEHPASDLIETAGYFSMPVGEILAAISEADEHSPAGGFSARTTTTTPLKLLEAARQWGPVCIAVGGEAGATSELQFRQFDVRQHGPQLCIDNPAFGWRIDGASIRAAWLVRHDDGRRMFCCVDGLGKRVFSLSPLHVDGAPDEEIVRCFDSLCATE